MSKHGVEISEARAELDAIRNAKKVDELRDVVRRLRVADLGPDVWETVAGELRGWIDRFEEYQIRLETEVVPKQFDRILRVWAVATGSTPEEVDQKRSQMIDDGKARRRPRVEAERASLSEILWETLEATYESALRAGCRGASHQA